MGFFRKVERRGAKRAKRSVFIPVLNAPFKRLEIPVAVRDRILTSYGLSTSMFQGETPFHAVFVVEGLTLAFITKSPLGARLTLHLLELSGPDRELVGAAICETWEKVVASPEVLTFTELQTRYNEFAAMGA